MKKKSSTSVDIGYATILGQELRYAFMGPKDADRTLLAFNGIGASLEAVVPFANCFERTRILTFDAPGVGESPTPLIPYRFNWLAEIIAGLLDHLGIEDVDVTGVSWGGAAAQQFAYDFQDRIHTLTLCATSAGMVMVPGNIDVLRKMATPKRYMDPGHMMKIAPEIYGGQIRTNAEVLRMHASNLKAGDSRGYTYQLLAGMGWTSYLWLPQIETPTLLLMGEDDPLVPPINGKILMSRLPNAQMITMECGHLFILSIPQDTASKMEAFIHDGIVVGAQDFSDDGVVPVT
ncbi:MAG: poly(3-hydroxyalkanoate) depolymerase [Pseudomonadota bacterium]